MNIDYSVKNLVRRCAALAAATYTGRSLAESANSTESIIYRAEKFVEFLERGR